MRDPSLIVASLCSPMLQCEKPVSECRAFPDRPLQSCRRERSPGLEANGSQVLGFMPPCFDHFHGQSHQDGLVLGYVVQ